MGKAKQQRRRNFRAARLRRKLRLRQQTLDRMQCDNVFYAQCDLPPSGHAAANSAGHPSPEAQEKAPPRNRGDFLI